jgi:hypothetical protein
VFADTHIGSVRVRVKGKSADPLSTELRVSSMLNALHLQPSGFSLPAIVLINRLKDPMPGKLHLRSGGMCPPPEWEQAVRDSIATLVRNAARPAHGSVSGNSDAVIFSDRAELLACLAVDMCDGSALTRWWWKSLFRTKDVSRAVLDLWLDMPEYAPAAFEHLSTRGNILRFIQRLGPVETKMLLSRIIQRFALHAMEPAIAPLLEKSGHEIGLMASGIFHSERDIPARGEFSGKYSEMKRPENAPWYAWVPESAGAAPCFVRQCLVGIGLMLIRAPAVVRSASFAHAVNQWFSAGALDMADSWDFTTVASSLPKLALTRETASEKMDVPQAIISQDSIPCGASDRELGDAHSESGKSPLPDMIKGSFTRDEQANPYIDPLSKEDPTTNEKRSPPGVEPDDGSADIAAAEPLFEESVDTEYGGIFYLINLGIYIGLYGDFTSPRNPGISLSIWDFIALAGLHMVGQEIKTDPVWPLLSRMAGRNGHKEPGRDFDPPDQWRLPGEWLRPFPEENIWKWNVQGERLIVKHGGGFPVLDLEAKDDHIAQLNEATGDHHFIFPVALEKDDSLGTAEYDSSLDRWIGWILPYIKARLIKALGKVDPGDIAGIYMKSHARVNVSPTRLDLFFSLDELPIEIRLSGLDRNPGWVPSAGRHIHFHFV